MNLEKEADAAQVYRYLLGNLSPEEQENIERRFFTDADFSEQVAAFETDLIDKYVQQELSGTELRQFEARFLTSPARRERIAFAHALVKPSEKAPAPAVAAQPAPPVRQGWWQVWVESWRNLALGPQLVLATCAVVAVVGGVRLAWLAMELKNQLAGMQQDQAQLQQQNQNLDQQLAAARQTNQQLAATLENERMQREKLAEQVAQAPAPAVFSFILIPGLMRDSVGADSFVLPGQVNSVRMKLILVREDSYPSYQLVLKSETQQTLWTGTRLKTEKAKKGRQVVGEIPAKQLKPGNYTLILFGKPADGPAEELDDYPFKVRKK